MKLTCASPCELLAARDGSAALPDLGVDGWELPVRRKLLPALPGLRDGCAGHMAAFEWLLLPVLVTLSPAEASHRSLVPLCKDQYLHRSQYMSTSCKSAPIVNSVQQQGGGFIAPRQVAAAFECALNSVPFSAPYILQHTGLADGAAGHAAVISIQRGLGASHL